MEEDDVIRVVENRALTPDEIGLLASLIAEEPDHYTVLGVNRNATNDEIQNAYCLAVEYFHPLKSAKITESDSVMHWRLSSAYLRIEEAFTVLSRASRRKIYDDNLGSDLALPSPRRPVNQRFKSRIPSRDSRSNATATRPNATATRPVSDGGRARERRRVERVPLNLPIKVTFERHWQEISETCLLYTSPSPRDS